MKARLVPLYFEPGRDSGFDDQLNTLRDLLGEHAELLPPVPLGAPLPEADAVVFPQLLGEGYRRLDDFKAIRLPILIVTSQFGTLSMWDWELISYLKAEGVETIAPYDLAQTKKICNALRVKRELRAAKFVVYQDNPGEGAQASIFKRFYWWEDECTQRMNEKFGVTIEKRSFRELGARAKTISDHDAEDASAKAPVPIEGIAGKPLNSAYKLYLAVKHDLEADPSIRAIGINCLNESHFSDTTPCLAWNLLYEEKKLIWGCEGDTVSMLTKYLLHHSLEAPILMTNLYPFLLGNAALKHERIESFPAVPDDPANYILVAHCGYMGVIPKSFCSSWTLRKKALAIVDENATAIDARIPTGDITLAKLKPNFREITVAEGSLTGYAQYPGSDCRNGGVVRVRDGHRLMNALSSHHSLLMTGRHLADLRLVTKVFDLGIEEI
jgi:L-fucose isomerase-like protein